MNKADLVAEVQRRMGADCSRSHAERAVHALFAAIESGLRREGEVQIVGFGTFEVKERRARLGSHPRTQQPIEIQATRTVGFRAGSALREALDQRDTGGDAAAGND